MGKFRQFVTVICPPFDSGGVLRGFFCFVFLLFFFLLLFFSFVEFVTPRCITLRMVNSSIKY